MLSVVPVKPLLLASTKNSLEWAQDKTQNVLSRYGGSSWNCGAGSTRALKLEVESQMESAAVFPVSCLCFSLHICLILSSSFSLLLSASPHSWFSTATLQTRELTISPVETRSNACFLFLNPPSIFFRDSDWPNMGQVCNPHPISWLLGGWIR